MGDDDDDDDDDGDDGGGGGGGNDDDDDDDDAWWWLRVSCDSINFTGVVLKQRVHYRKRIIRIFSVINDICQLHR